MIPQWPKLAAWKKVNVVLDPRYQLPDVGTYTVEGDTSQHWVSVDIPCPYCKEPLQERSGGGHYLRTLATKVVNGATSAYSVPIPQTHKFLACFGCDARFTIPR